jgi:hypothetical protein
MSLVQRLEALATRLGLEVKRKIGADHPGVARAWVCFGIVDAQVILRSAHNVAAVIRLGKGRYRVHFDTPLPDADYAWTAWARSNTDSGQQRNALVRASADLKTPEFVDVVCATSQTSFGDSAEINLVVYR